VVRALDAEHIKIADFQLHAPSLDDVFLAKTGKKLSSEDDAATGEHLVAEPVAS
jgi:ABC-2 type transport system ATP-binding protein